VWDLSSNTACVLSYDINAHLDGFLQSRTESKASILINSQRSFPVVRIVTEKDSLINAESVGQMQDRGSVI